MSSRASALRRPVVVVALATAVVLGLVLAGSAIYWLGDGGVGTPADFRQRVADTGLAVEWSNSGPRGGSGVLDTECGPVNVTIDDVDDELWVRWDDRREPVGSQAVDDLIACR